MYRWNVSFRQHRFCLGFVFLRFVPLCSMRLHFTLQCRFSTLSDKIYVVNTYGYVCFVFLWLERCIFRPENPPASSCNHTLNLSFYPSTPNPSLAPVYSMAPFGACHMLSPVVQVVALAYYIMSYFPGGAQGMQFALSMAGRAILSCFGSVTRSGS